MKFIGRIKRLDEKMLSMTIGDKTKYSASIERLHRIWWTRVRALKLGDNITLIADTNGKDEEEIS